MMNSVVHFEMPYVDPERMATFYQSVFGWETKHLGEGMGDYMLATTTETDQAGPRRPGAINGGFFPKQDDHPTQGPSIVIAVDDIDAAIERVNQGGGNVLGEPMPIPGVGRYVSFIDPEGNQLSMLQPVRSDGQGNGPGGGTTHASRASRAGASPEGTQEWSPKRSTQSGSTPGAGRAQKAWTEPPGSKKPARRRS